MALIQSDRNIDYVSDLIKGMGSWQLYITDELNTLVKVLTYGSLKIAEEILINKRFLKNLRSNKDSVVFILCEYFNDISKKDFHFYKRESINKPSQTLLSQVKDSMDLILRIFAEEFKGMNLKSLISYLSSATLEKMLKYMDIEQVKTYIIIFFLFCFNFMQIKGLSRLFEIQIYEEQSENQE